MVSVNRFWVWKGYCVKKGLNYAPKRRKPATDLRRENLQRLIKTRMSGLFLFFRLSKKFMLMFNHYLISVFRLYFFLCLKVGCLNRLTDRWRHWFFLHLDFCRMKNK
ncbi:hypothetical protein Hdeb2414_s0011g00373041 [Helianthus debilis subsp. tardiflorus]